MTEDRIRIGVINEGGAAPEWYWRQQIEAIEKERDALKAKQTRWVKCSERMPTIANSEDEPYLCRITVKDDPATWRVLADWGDGRFKPFDTLLTGWTVIAWLENVPEYVP